MLKKDTQATGKLLLMVLLLGLNAAIQAQTTEGTTRTAAKDSINTDERFSYHFQTTVIAQHQLDFTAPYSGTNSLLTSEPERLSLTSTLFLGARLWKGAAIFLNPELSGGNGLSSTRGVAGFPNGETYRIGDPEPVVSISRLFLRQTFSLSNDWQNTECAQNVNAGRTATSRIVITLGKFSVTDIFDANTYSHDPRNQFMNWAIMSAGAWDYPANTRGYTYGLIAELIKPHWSIKAGLTMVPETANGPFMDMNVNKANSATLEMNKTFKVNKRMGVVRLIGYFTQGNMGSYATASADTPYHPHIEPTRSYAHAKGGFVINIEQELTKNTGVFARLSWNDGKNETWAFTEIDRSMNIGAQLSGRMWKRKSDKLGIAFLINGLSGEHRKYLAAGGYGFIIGDGRLNYGNEQILELYYSAKILSSFWLSPDYQLVVNPAYNRDRGPVVHIIGVRGHIEF